MTDETKPRDQSELLARIEREWALLLRTVERLTPEQMSRQVVGTWSVKDNLAHLAEWEQFMLRCYLNGEPQHAVMQIDQATFEQLDADGINAVLYNRNKDRPAQDVLEGLKQSHARVLATLEAMPFADLLKTYDADDPEHRTVLDEVIGNTYEHYAGHRAAIEQIVARNAPGKKIG